MANTTWVTTPISIFVAKTLQGVIDTFKQVASNTDDVIIGLGEAVIREDTSVRSYDVEKLYPSISQDRATESIRRCITKYYVQFPIHRWGAFVEFLMALIGIIFSAQFAMLSCDEKKYFRQTRGISTGLACGSQLANMFLSCLDETIIASFGADIALYKRYIEDILIVAHNVALHSFLEIMNSFDPDIRITHDSSETDKETSFLDVYIDITGGYVHYSTYRKPMCMYDYLPFSSWHDRNCKLGIFKEEVFRLLKTNLQEDDFL